MPSHHSSWVSVWLENIPLDSSSLERDWKGVQFFRCKSSWKNWCFVTAHLERIRKNNPNKTSTSAPMVREIPCVQSQMQTSKGEEVKNPNISFDVTYECSLIRLHIDSMSTERFIIGQRALPSKMGLSVSLSLCRPRTPIALSLWRRDGRCGQEKKGFSRMYSVVQKNSCLFEFPAFLPPGIVCIHLIFCYCLLTVIV